MISTNVSHPSHPLTSTSITFTDSLLASIVSSIPIAPHHYSNLIQSHLTILELVYLYRSIGKRLYHQKKKVHPQKVLASDHPQRLNESIFLAEYDELYMKGPTSYWLPSIHLRQWLINAQMFTLNPRRLLQVTRSSLFSMMRSPLRYFIHSIHMLEALFISEISLLALRLPNLIDITLTILPDVDCTIKDTIGWDRVTAVEEGEAAWRGWGKRHSHQGTLEPDSSINKINNIVPMDEISPPTPTSIESVQGDIVFPSRMERLEFDGPHDPNQCATMLNLLLPALCRPGVAPALYELLLPALSISPSIDISPILQLRSQLKFLGISAFGLSRLEPIMTNEQAAIMKQVDWLEELDLTYSGELPPFKEFVSCFPSGPNSTLKQFVMHRQKLDQSILMMLVEGAPNLIALEPESIDPVIDFSLFGRLKSLRALTINVNAQGWGWLSDGKKKDFALRLVSGLSDCRQLEHLRIGRLMIESKSMRPINSNSFSLSAVPSYSSVLTPGRSVISDPLSPVSQNSLLGWLKKSPLMTDSSATKKQRTTDELSSNARTETSIMPNLLHSNGPIGFPSSPPSVNSSSSVHTTPVPLPPLSLAVELDPLMHIAASVGTHLLSLDLQGESYQLHALQSLDFLAYLPHLQRLRIGQCHQMPLNEFQQLHLVGQTLQALYLDRCFPVYDLEHEVSSTLLADLLRILQFNTCGSIESLPVLSITTSANTSPITDPTILWFISKGYSVSCEPLDLLRWTSSLPIHEIANSTLLPALRYGRFTLREPNQRLRCIFTHGSRLAVHHWQEAIATNHSGPFEWKEGCDLEAEDRAKLDQQRHLRTARTN